jgi:O-antigen ligase
LSAAAEHVVKAEPRSASLRKNHRTEILEAAVLWLLVVGLAWVPFWYGSNELGAWGVNAVLFAGLAAAYEVALLVRGKPHPVGIRHLALPLGLLLAVLSWIWLQTVTWLPTAWLHPVWVMAADALGATLRGSISVDRDLTELALVRLITAASVFWTTLQLCRNGARANLLVSSIAAIGCLYAAYGLVALRFGQLPLLDIPADGIRVSSTFVNRDSFATYAGICLVATIGMIFRSYRSATPNASGSVRFRAASFAEATGTVAAAPLAGGFLILVALLLTGSRGGITATGLGLVVFSVLAYRQRELQRKFALWSLLAGSISVLAIATVFGGNFFGNLEQGGVYDRNRVAVYALTMRSIADAPLRGFGYGTFADVFPMYRDRSLDVAGIWSQAHNTYLEVFQGLGLVFGAMLLGTVGLLVWCCVKGAVMRHRLTVQPGVAAAAACVVGLHALVDFSLQIQAVALTFAALLGAGVAQSASSRKVLDD